MSSRAHLALSHAIPVRLCDYHTPPLEQLDQLRITDSVLLGNLGGVADPEGWPGADAEGAAMAGDTGIFGLVDLRHQAAHAADAGRGGVDLVRTCRQLMQMRDVNRTCS